MSAALSELLNGLRDGLDALPSWARLILGYSIGALAVVPTAYYVYSRNAKRPSPYKQNFEKDVVYLFQFFRSPSIPSASPYCLKLETWLRLYSVKYEV